MPQLQTEPQSCWQLFWFSPQIAWQMPFPQTQAPQSCGQLFWFSKQFTWSHLPSPQAQTIIPQSIWQEFTLSPQAGSHLPSPQRQPPPQSMGQLFCDSTH